MKEIRIKLNVTLNELAPSGVVVVVVVVVVDVVVVVVVVVFFVVGAFVVGVVVLVEDISLVQIGSVPFHKKLSVQISSLWPTILYPLKQAKTATDCGK